MKLSIISLAIVIAAAFLGGRSRSRACRRAAEVGEQRPRWILVYKVDEQKCVWRPDKMDSLVAAISNRINAHWWNGISVKGLAPTWCRSTCRA